MPDENLDLSHEELDLGGTGQIPAGGPTAPQMGPTPPPMPAPEGTVVLNGKAYSPTEVDAWQKAAANKQDWERAYKQRDMQFAAERRQFQQERDVIYKLAQLADTDETVKQILMERVYGTGGTQQAPPAVPGEPTPPYVQQLQREVADMKQWREQRETAEINARAAADLKVMHETWEKHTGQKMTWEDEERIFREGVHGKDILNPTAAMYYVHADKFFGNRATQVQAGIQQAQTNAAALGAQPAVAPGGTQPVDFSKLSREDAEVYARRAAGVSTDPASRFTEF